MLELQEYFDEIEKKLFEVYDIANKARSLNYDPSEKVEVVLAKNMAERVVGLISAIAPQITNTKIPERIEELEEQYGKLDWRVALTLGLEVAQEKFCEFKDEREAMEVGIRTGLAYLSLGVVTSPLDGFAKLELKNTRDGKKYFCLYFSGPIRSAGTTVVCGSIAVADYIRQKMGYSPYDPTEEEIKRMITELIDFHERITNLQYFPSEEECDFMLRHLPIQLDGDPSEDLQVSNYKDLPRIETNFLRNGPCLVLGEALTQKAPKFWAQISKWGKSFDLDNWNFLEDFIKLQKKVRAEGKIEKIHKEITPDYNYIKDLVAGRPILTHPLATGGFRLRYGRSRTSGLASLSINPITMLVLDNFIATGTQLKYERPGKSTAVAPCDTIEGPIVKLKNGDVIFLDTTEDAQKILNNIEEILFLGDILINYGEFFNRAHKLVPPGYCEEWWLQEIKNVEGNPEKLSKITGIDKEFFEDLFKNPTKKISLDESIIISKNLNIPLHPRYTFHWKDISQKQLLGLVEWLNKGTIENSQKIILPLTYNVKEILEEIDPKRVLELLGIPHKMINKEYVIIEGDWAKSFILSFGFLNKNLNIEKIINNISENEDVLTIINKLSEIKLRDKSGTFIGARMGRPEKAKLRKLIGSPHIIFPVGSEGGRLRSFQSALDAKKITGDFPIYYCKYCANKTIYSICENCNKKTERMYYCDKCNKDISKEICSLHGKTLNFKQQQIDINHFFERALKTLKLKETPVLIKGVRGTSNKDHVVENLVKGISRAINELYVNKDGTIRYDMTEMPITHFKPKEIGTSIEKLKELGYTKDIYGNYLEKDEQLLEIKPQDVILPMCSASKEEGADIVLLRVANFIDSLLENFYKLKRFYNVKSKEDLIGHFIVGLAPHTSAGIIGRIIGFSKTQCCYAHPLWHSAQRRDCFGYDTNIPLLIEGIWQNVKIGDFVEKLNPNQIVDSYGTLAKDVNNISTLAYNYKTNKIDVINVKWFTKHQKSRLIKLNLENGREIKTTIDHKFYIKENSKINIKRAFEIEKGDKLIIPYNFDFPDKDLTFLDLERIYCDREDIMIKGIKSYLINKIKILGMNSFCKKFSLNKKNIYNYKNRDSTPIILVNKMLKYFNEDFDGLPKKRNLSVKRNFVMCPYKIPVDKDFLEIIGFYIAEGYAKQKLGEKGYYRVDFSINEDYLRERLKKKIFKIFKILPNKTKTKSLTYHSKIFYEIITKILCCGHNAHTKRIPNLFLNLPKNKIAYLLKAYYEGDGSVSKSDLRVVCDTVSKGLIHDLELVLARFGIYVKKYKSKREPGKTVKEFYIRKNRKIPKFESTKLNILSKFTKIYYDNINFISRKKRNKLDYIIKNIKPIGPKIDYDNFNAYLKIINKEVLNHETTYCLNVPGHHNVIANGIIARQCEGDEHCIMLLMDTLLNFSKEYLPSHKGATQDSPLVLTSKLIPSEVDDMVFDLDIVWEYPLSFYEAALNYKNPWDIKMEQIDDRLSTDKKYSNFGFTHNVKDLNMGINCSAYKSLPTMMDKVRGQMLLADKIRAVDENDVAKLVIERHFLRDIKGNLRKFSMQEFRCVNCNVKYRRPPLSGICLKCGGKLIFTISEGGIVKYLQPSIELANKYMLSPYLKQTLELTKQRVESVFGKESERQEGLSKWFS